MSTWAHSRDSLINTGESHSPLVTITFNPWIEVLFLILRVVKLYASISFLKYIYIYILRININWNINTLLKYSNTYFVSFKAVLLLVLTRGSKLKIPLINTIPFNRYKYSCFVISSNHNLSYKILDARCAPALWPEIQTFLYKSIQFIQICNLYINKIII